MDNVNTVYYDLNQSQTVIKLQCKYTLFKRVINIITSMSVDKEIDLEVMKKAFNLMVERNDCMRLKFVKKDKKVKQYFAEKVVLDEIPYKEYGTEKEFLDFIDQIKLKPVGYMKGESFCVWFCKVNGKFTILLKVCHLILDIYGLNIIFKDLFEIYDALVNNTELPPAPAKFEEVIKNDLNRRADEKKHDLEKAFFLDFFKDRPRPSYAGVHGKELPRWQKLVKKGHTAMTMFFIKNDTAGTKEVIEKKDVDKLLNYCKETRITPANFLFYLTSLTASKMNDVKNMIHLELCNCRGTLAERKSAGTKVQSLGCYTEVDPEKSFKENIEYFVTTQNELYRHIGFEDTEFEMLLNSCYRKPLLQIFYSITFSFIPMDMQEGTEFNVYSNGKGALPCYLGFMYDVKAGNIVCAYDYQTKIITREDIKRYNDNIVKILNQVIDNPEIKVKDIKL